MNERRVQNQLVVVNLWLLQNQAERLNQQFPASGLRLVTCILKLETNGADVKVCRTAYNMLAFLRRVGEDAVQGLGTETTCDDGKRSF